jgi:Fe-S-cluster containining protein
VTAAPEDCTSCGCCCFSTDERYIAVFEVDRARMDARALALTQEIAGRRYMRFEGGRCVALQLDGGRYTCSIYLARPDPCRWLQRASGECLSQIAQKREIALIALRSSCS